MLVDKDSRTNAMDYARVYVDVDLSLFTIDVVKIVSYRFAEYAPSLEMSSNDNKIRVYFSLDPGAESAQIESLINDFNIALVDDDLRQTIRNETETARNLILAYAFADTKLVEE